MDDTPLTPPDSEKTSTGMEPNTAALLCYLFTWVTGLIFLLIEKENKYVRFHAMQSILFGVAVILVGVALFVVARVLNIIPFLGPMMTSVLYFAYWIGSIVLYIVLMVKAYQGEMYKLPVIGDIAERNI